MWCSHCQQDVPAAATPTTGSLCCTGCHRPIRPAFAAADKDASDTRVDGAPVDGTTDPRAPRHADDTRLRRIGQTLRSARRKASSPRSDSLEWRIDQAQPTQDIRPAARRLQPVAPQPTRPRRDPNQDGQAIAWAVAVIGATALGAGLGMIGLSLFGERDALWNWGLFATLGGQGFLVVGLTLLLANLWTNARASTNRLVSLQNEVLRLQRSTEALTGHRTATATRFYADLARGASPELLVANLRGQLDELSASLPVE